MTESLAGKVAVVTGGGRGLGRAAALAFASAGASVVVVSRTEGEIRETAELAGAGRGLAVPGDVSSPETARLAVRGALERFGRLDILMNNAAVAGPFRRIAELEDREWDAALGVNLKGAFLFAREAIPHIGRGGAVINVTSGLGSFALSPFGMYCISKAGINQLTRLLAQELADTGIAVNGLDPGVMDTSMQEEIRGAGPEVLGRDTWGRFVAFREKGVLAPVEKTARLAVFLASPPDGVTGEIGDAAHFRRHGFRG
ncbi:MAG TPA: SDR family oxidoreductase [Verrucomicrobiae bacterium]|nr:SDR family oxidoreductase [Verrucomicrobiae bacterium]